MMKVRTSVHLCLGSTGCVFESKFFAVIAALTMPEFEGSQHDTYRWAGGMMHQFEDHVLQMATALAGHEDCEILLKHWLSQLHSTLVECPLQLPQFGEWLYLFITDARMTVIQRTLLLVLAAAGHPWAQRIVVVDKASHSIFFGEPVRIQREMAKMQRSWTKM